MLLGEFGEPGRQEKPPQAVGNTDPHRTRKRQVLARNAFLGAGGKRLDRLGRGNQPVAGIGQQKTPVARLEQLDLQRILKRIDPRSEEHTPELQSLMRISYAVFCLKKKKRL